MPNTERGFNQIKLCTFETKDVQEETVNGRKRLNIRGFASREVLDMDGEIVHVGFFDRYLPEFLANPQMYWQHGWADSQGLWTLVEGRPGEGYWAEGYMVHLGTPEDDRRFAMVEEGLVKSLSVGFLGYHTPEYGYYEEGADGRPGTWHWTQNGRLMEISPVTVPACPGAGFALGKSLGLTLEPQTDTPAESEEDRAVRNLEKLANAAESLGNISRHWAKEGGGPSAEMAGTAVRSIIAAMGILKAGRVLSAANRSAVVGAVEALQEVLAKDDASRETPEPNNEDSKSGVLDIIMPAPRTVEIVS